jgi:hypothetical protein
VGFVLVANDFGGFGFCGKMLRVQVVAGSGKDIIKGVVEVSEDVSFSSFLLSFFAPRCRVFFSLFCFFPVYGSLRLSPNYEISIRGIGFLDTHFTDFPNNECQGTLNPKPIFLSLSPWLFLVL